MAYRYAVVGAGRQGVAAGYDLAKFGDAKEIIFIDKNADAATMAANRVNTLICRPVARGRYGNAANASSMKRALRNVHAFASAAHYTLNPRLTALAIECGVHMVDMGGNTDVVWRQRGLDVPAQAKNVTIVPDCGMGPGFNVNLVRYAIEQVAVPRKAHIWCGGLPQKPSNPPLNYELLFSLSGLVNEYTGFADVLWKGWHAKKPCLTGIETVPINRLYEFGMLEAAYTSGGLSTAPWTFRIKYPSLRQLTYKTLRYSGHWAFVRMLARDGLLEEELRCALGTEIRDVRDIGIIRVACEGKDKRGNRIVKAFEVFDEYDEETGFSAMQRLTGFHAAAVLALAVQRRIRPGVVPVECLDARLVVNEMRMRGVAVREIELVL